MPETRAEQGCTQSPLARAVLFLHHGTIPKINDCNTQVRLSQRSIAYVVCILMLMLLICIEVHQTAAVYRKCSLFLTALLHRRMQRGSCLHTCVPGHSNT